MPIKVLDPNTVSKIAAGEVIDRPNSIIKELIENSIDANATTLTIEIEKGGKQLIRITDNGSGISKDDLPKAPIRHATSKIDQFDDIYNIHSFGFRGEALSSIAHVAELEIQSKQPETDHAYCITAKDDTISSPNISNHNNGTTITVKNLFETIPVRKNFLKADSTETAYIYDTVLHFALIHPDKTFKLISNQQEMLNTTGITDTKTLLVHIFGKELKEKLIQVNSQYGNLHFKGIISDPTLTYSNRNKQFLAVNNRVLKIPLLSKALQNSFKDLIPHNRFPLVILNIDVTPNEIDVNIHPQKHDIKFIHPGVLFDSLPKIIKTSLQTQHTELNSLSSSPSFSTTTDTHYSPQPNQQVNTPFNATTSQPFESQTDFQISQSAPQEERNTAQNVSSFTQNFQSKPVPPIPDNLHAPLPLNDTNLESLNNLDNLDNLEYLQILDTYIVIKAPSGIWILDQHAVHERILYEKIKDKHKLATETQPLLISECVDLGTDLIEVFKAENNTLTSLKFKIDEFGSNQVIIREVPIIFADINHTNWIKAFLEQVKDVPGSTIDLTQERKEKLQMMACKAAIKAGKTLHREEVKQLIRDFQKSPSNFTCPHGRPLFIKLTKNDLEKQFLRV